MLLCRGYIELNPVRAGMVGDPAQYRWSSYRHNGAGEPNRRLTLHPVCQALGRGEASRLAAYRALFRSELDECAVTDLRPALAQARALGSEKFKEAISQASGVRWTQARRGRPEKGSEGAGEEG